MIKKIDFSYINKKFIKPLYLVFFSLVVLFGRSFTGIYILEYRLGELMVGFLILVGIWILIYPAKNQPSYFGLTNTYIHKLILANFVISVLLTQGSFVNTYTYQSSSYIWTLGFLLLGVTILKDFNLSKNNIYIFASFLPALYVLSSVKFPKFIMDFFINYSDKFDFVKASDLLIVFVATNFLMSLVYKNNKNDFVYFILSSAAYLPYLLFKSKGAFFPAVIFIFFNLYYFIKFMKKNKTFSFVIILISIFTFLISTFHIYGNFNFTKEGQENFDDISLTDTSSVVSNLSMLLEEKNTSQIFASFYIIDGRLYSQEQMADWRLQIWQDISRDIFWYADYSTNSKGTVIRDQKQPRYDLFYRGFGYNEKLPAMDFSERSGTDGTNENPHNFLIYSLGRGGLFNLLLFSTFHFSIIVYFYKRDKSFKTLLFLIPVLMTSFFDASMESVRFPFVYYTYMAIVYNFTNKTISE